MKNINSKFPQLELPTIQGDHWKLSETEADNFIMLVFYRGYHCPVCKKYNKEIQSKIDDFIDRGVEVVAISCDSRERAMKTKEDWGMDKLKVAYNLPVEQAEELGLYISQSISDKEPDYFSEPALFLLRPDLTVHAAYYQSLPFARPPLDQLLEGIDYILEEDYPARGTVEHIGVTQVS